MSVYGQVGKLRQQLKQRTMMTWLDPVVSGLAQTIDYLSPRLAPPPTEVTEAPMQDGHKLVLPAGLPSARRLLEGVYEPEVTTVIRSLLDRGMTFVDAGASVGYYTLLGAGLVGEAGQVFAFEPDAQAYTYLKSNVANNHARNVVATNAALSDRRGFLTFTPSALEGGFLSFGPTRSSSSRQVETVTLDGFFAQLGWPPVHMIKMDVEGAEAAVLAGMTELSARNDNLSLVMEFNSIAMQRAGTTRQAMSDALTRLGFGNAYIIELDTRPIPLTKPLPRSGLVYNLLATKVGRS